MGGALSTPVSVDRRRRIRPTASRAGQTRSRGLLPAGSARRSSSSSSGFQLQYANLLPGVVPGTGTDGRKNSRDGQALAVGGSSSPRSLSRGGSSTFSGLFEVIPAMGRSLSRGPSNKIAPGNERLRQAIINANHGPNAIQVAAVTAPIKAVKSLEELSKIAEEYELPPFPKKGVTLLFLQRLRDYIASDPKCNPKWTTDEVSANLVKPWTEQRQCSFDEYMMEEFSDEPNPATGLTYTESFGVRATIFVSHTWRYEFVELIEAIETFFEDQENGRNGAEIGPDGEPKIKPETSYLWIDLFTNNQWKAPLLPYEWWSGTFLSAIGEIGHTMLVLSPWDAPIPLTRAWCLWEIHCTILTKAKLTVQLSSKERKAFQKKLREDFAYIMKAFCQLDVRHSEAASTMDKQMIFEAVQHSEGGFRGVNNSIMEPLRDWLVEAARDIVAGSMMHISKKFASKSSRALTAKARARILESRRHSLATFSPSPSKSPTSKKQEEHSGTAAGTSGGDPGTVVNSTVETSGTADIASTPRASKRKSLDSVLLSRHASAASVNVNSSGTGKPAKSQIENSNGNNKHHAKTNTASASEYVAANNSKSKNNKETPSPSSALTAEQGSGVACVDGVTGSDAATDVQLRKRRSASDIMADSSTLKSCGEEACSVRRSSLDSATNSHKRIPASSSNSKLQVGRSSGSNPAHPAKPAKPTGTSPARSPAMKTKKGKPSGVDNSAPHSKPGSKKGSSRNSAAEVRFAENPNTEIIVPGSGDAQASDARTTTKIPAVVEDYSDSDNSSDDDGAENQSPVRPNTTTKTKDFVAQLEQARSRRRMTVLHAQKLHELDDTVRLALILKQQHKTEEARNLYQAALAGYEKLVGPNHPSSLRAIAGLGNLMLEQSDYKEASKLYNRALEGCEQTLGPDHPDTLSAVSNVATLMTNINRFDVAEQMFLRVLRGREIVLREGHPDTLRTVNNLANVYKKMKKFSESEQMYNRALHGREDTLGYQHPDTLDTVSDFAGLMERQNKFEKARVLYERALVGREKMLGVTHPQTLVVVNNLAVVLHNLKEFDRAELMYHRALQGRLEVLGEGHSDTLWTMKSLATLLQHAKKFKEAMAYFERVLVAQRKFLGAQHPETLATEKQLKILNCDIVSSAL